MILREIHLASFGDYQGRSVSGFEPGLNILYGGNEAGKSTLLGALRFGLFGSVYKGHEPSAGGKRRVELLLEREGRQWRLTRLPGGARSAFRLEPADGGDPIPLEEYTREWLDGVSFSRFSNVYALGLGELAWDVDVRDMLLDAGFGDLGRRLRQAISTTEAASEALFRPSAGRPLNQALAERERALEDERRWAARPRELDAAEGEARDSQAAVDALDLELRDLGRRLDGAQALLAARGQWDALGAVDHQIAALAHVADFPASAPGAFAQAEEKHTRALGAAAEAAARAQAAKGELEHLRVEAQYLVHAAEVAELAVAAERLFDLPEQLRDAERHAALAREGARQEAQRGCGPHAEPAGLAALDASAAAVGSLQAQAGELAAALRQLEQAEEKERQAREAAGEAARQEAEARRALDASPAPPDVRVLQERRRRCEEHDQAVARLRQVEERRTMAVERLGGLQERREKDEAARKNAREQQEALDRRRAEGEKLGAPGGGRSARLVLLAAGIALVIGGIALLVMQQTLGGIGLTVGGLVMLGVGAVLPAASVIIPTIEIALPPATVSDAEIQAALQKVSAGTAERDAAAAELSRVAREIGLAVDATAQQVQKLRNDLDQEIRLAMSAHADRASLETDARRASQERARCEAALGAASNAVRDARALAEAARERWRKWITERGLPGDLSPEAAGTYLDGVRAVQGRLLEASKADTAARELRERLERFRERAQELAGSLGTPLDVEDPWGITAARQWGKALEEARAQDARRVEWQKQLQDAADEEACQVGVAGQAAGQMAEALRHAGARDKDDLIQRARDAERLRGLRVERQQVEASIRGARDDAGWEAFQEALRVADWAGAQAEAEALGRAIEAKREERDGLQQAIGQARLRIEEMQTETALAEAQLRVQNAEAQVRHHARAWAGQAAAGALLMLTRSLFERDRQPEAVRRAGEMFEGITGGKWRGVVSLSDSIKVVGAEGTGVERETELLSRGAREALFLCARLAAIERAAERSPLPVALDDVLVNLDPERRRRALELVSGLAVKTQVLLFTCHPFIVDEATAGGRPCSVLSL